MSDIGERLRAALGPDKVRIGADVPARNHADSSRLTPTAPAILLLPRSTQDVAAALTLCHAAGQPVVTQGGLTGLAGGAHPHKAEVALSLERMSGIEEIDLVAGTLTALAGTPLHLIQDAAEEAGFLCGIDLGARGSCTIGGNVATNAGGNRVLRYGMTRRNVLGLEAVLADGTVVTSLNKMLKNNAGYDWTQLMIGTEGTLGVVTRVVLALHPRPAGIAAALVAVPDFEAIVRVQRALERDLPGGLLVFEAMWREMIALATGPCGLPRPFAGEHEAALLIEVAGGEGATAELEAVLGRLYEDGTVADALIAQSEGDRNRFWSYRESPYEYDKVFGPHVSFDISIPRARMAEAVAGLRTRVHEVWSDATTAIFGHVADSNLHVAVIRPGLARSTRTAIEPVVYETVARFAGSVSAEHGIGRNKRDYLHLSRSAAEIALMRTLKRSLDPRDILNPGRVLPPLVAPGV